jgi:hypothetical protein
VIVAEALPACLTVSVSYIDDVCEIVAVRLLPFWRTVVFSPIVCFCVTVMSLIQAGGRACPLHVSPVFGFKYLRAAFPWRQVKS